MALAAGTRLASYEILAFIGTGAMGAIYRARDLKLGRSVAVKVLLEELSQDRDRLRRFEQEARAASALNHPNIVHIYDIGQTDDTHFIVMELVEGSNLRRLLRDAPFGNERVAGIGRQLAAGLANAHRAGIVHRDVKPENIMVTDDGFVKILDFGLAKLLEFPLEGLSEVATLPRLGTRHGMLIGTVEYMSPEQAAGRPVDHRSDQFSLGLILYEMATGTMAFRRETAAQTLAAIIESEPATIAERNPQCPEGLIRIIRRCLEKSPDRRYQDARELVRELESVSLEERRPPIPPVPQNPEPDVPPLATSIVNLVGREINEALSEVSQELSEAHRDEQRYHVRDEDGRTRTLTAKKLRKRLRNNQYSGSELVRQGERGPWHSLRETEIFRQEVPVPLDPDGTQQRSLRGFLQHAVAFLGVGVVWFFLKGEVPFWMAYWGIGLAVHGVKAAPAAFSRVGGSRKAPATPKTPPGVAEELLSQTFLDEVERVKELLAERGGRDVGALTQEVDRIVAHMIVLAKKRRDLDEQTSEEERARLAASIDECERKLAGTTTAGDRRLYQRQLDVLRRRRHAIDKSRVVIQRFAIRQNLAEHEVKQLRLDLLREDAAKTSAPELTSRLRDIRHEVDAQELVDEAIAQELTS